MPQLIEVRFKGNRKEFFTWDKETPLSPGKPVVVKLERGEDLGYVSANGELADKKCAVACDGCAEGTPPEPRGKVVRTASGHDAHLADELRKAEEEVRHKVIEKVRRHGLDMKVADAEWQWDRKKLTIYFTSEKRVDFRALVRDLAGLFRTRIELRQIGARDEAKRLDGVGRCGRQYCCSSWLPELLPVSLSLAKDQRLSLNPSQISGGCGRLLCCLRYEHEFYVSARKRFPKEGKIVRTVKGEERVRSIDIFRERVLLESEDGTSRTITLAELKEAGHDTGVPAAEITLEPPETPMTAVEGQSEPEVKATTETVSPQRKRRRRRRRGRGRRKAGPGESDEAVGKEGDSEAELDG